MRVKVNVDPITNEVLNTIPSAVYAHLILDSQFETFYDSVTQLASKVCEVPVALITFLDDERIWIKSEFGFPVVKDIPRREVFCGLVVSNNQYLEISDTYEDELHKDHQLGIDGNIFRFYAGAPIKLPLGETIGVLCLFDTVPKSLTAQQRETLIGLADIVEKALVAKNSYIRLIK